MYNTYRDVSYGDRYKDRSTNIIITFTWQVGIIKEIRVTFNIGYGPKLTVLALQ